MAAAVPPAPAAKTRPFKCTCVWESARRCALERKLTFDACKCPCHNVAAWREEEIARRAA